MNKRVASYAATKSDSLDIEHTPVSADHVITDQAGNATAQPMKSKPLQLSVLQGPQRGAVYTLSADQELRLGFALLNDVVVRDSSIGDTCVALTLISNRQSTASKYQDTPPTATPPVLELNVLQGEVIHNDQVFYVGDEIVVPLAGTFGFGDTLIQFEYVTVGAAAFNSTAANSDSADTSPGSNAHSSVHAQASGDDAFIDNTFNDNKFIENTSRAGKTSVAGDPVNTAASSAVGQHTQSQRRLSHRILPAVAMLGVCLLIGGALWQWQNANNTSASVEPFSLEQQLSTANYNTLSVSREDNSVSVHGYLKTDSEQQAFSDWLRALPVNAENRVYSDQAIADQIATVLRANGVAAEIESLEQGRFVVSTTLPAGAQLEQLAKMIKTDVPQVAEVSIDNTLPNPFTPVSNTEELILDEGKRVSLVVSDDPSYIVTVDGSRYFSGSILPSGHRVVSIIEGRVLVEKDGTSTELKF